MSSGARGEGALEGWEPEYVIAQLATSLQQALEFSNQCSHLAPELQVAAQALAGRQQHLFDTTRRSVLRRSSGSG